MIDMSSFGRDHWSVFAYIATRILDYKGVPDRQHLRCDPKLHPGLVNVTPFGNVLDGGNHPTRLKDNVVLADHDDYSCIDDLEENGLLIIGGTGINPVYQFTTDGYEMWARLYRHKAEGGTFANFAPPPPLPEYEWGTTP